jgi:hypothetical protein
MEIEHQLTFCLLEGEKEMWNGMKNVEKDFLITRWVSHSLLLPLLNKVNFSSSSLPSSLLSFCFLLSVLHSSLSLPLFLLLFFFLLLLFFPFQILVIPFIFESLSFPRKTSWQNRVLGEATVRKDNSQTEEHFNTSKWEQLYVTSTSTTWDLLVKPSMSAKFL